MATTRRNKGFRKTAPVHTAACRPGGGLGAPFRDRLPSLSLALHQAVCDCLCTALDSIPGASRGCFHYFIMQALEHLRRHVHSMEPSLIVEGASESGGPPVEGHGASSKPLKTGGGPLSTHYSADHFRHTLLGGRRTAWQINRRIAAHCTTISQVQALFVSLFTVDPVIKSAILRLLTRCSFKKTGLTAIRTVLDWIFSYGFVLY